MRIVSDSTDFPTTENLKRNRATGEVTIDANHHLTDLCDANPLGYVIPLWSTRWVWAPFTSPEVHASTADTEHQAMQELLDDYLSGYVRESDAAEEHAWRDADDARGWVA